MRDELETLLERLEYEQWYLEGQAIANAYRGAKMVASWNLRVIEWVKTMIAEREKLSSCCHAPLLENSDTHTPDMGMCSHCRDWCGVSEEQQP